MVVQEEQYDPWGLSLTGLSSQTMLTANRFKYIGREEQQGLGWIDLQARLYDPQTGRFTGVDPLPDTERQESISTYHYSYNNPIRFSDPDGKMGEDCCDGIGSFLMGVGGAIRDNLSPDGGGSRRDTPANAGLYNSGREAGHQVSLVLSAGIIAAGVAGDVAAAAGEIASFGMATVPAAALAVASTGAVVYGAGVANNAINNRIDDKGRVYAKTSQETHQTYTKTNPQTGQVYSGRTKGSGTPAQNIAKRDAGHHMNGKGFGKAKLDQSSTNKKAIRGREQQLIEHHGGAQSEGGTSGNSINGIGPRNPKKKDYLNNANKEFGPI